MSCVGGSAKSPVQRCRNHKIVNVLEKLPDAVPDQVRSAMRAAYRLNWEEGIARMKTQDEWLQTMGNHDAAKSLLEGLEETFTVNWLVEFLGHNRMALGVPGTQ